MGAVPPLLTLSSPSPSPTPIDRDMSGLRIEAIAFFMFKIFTTGSPFLYMGVPRLDATPRCFVHELVGLSAWP